MAICDTLSRCSDYRDKSSNNKNIVLLCPELLAVHTLEGVKLKGLEKDLLSKIQCGNQTRDQEELMTKAAQELQQLASKVVYSMEWSNIDSLLHFWGKIYVLWNPDLRRCIVVLCYNIKVTGYPGC